MLRHRQDHERYLRHLSELRDSLEVPADWQINLEVECPADIRKFGIMTWEQLPNRQYWLTLCCGLSDAEVRWVICHELVECYLARYGELTEELMDRGIGIETEREHFDRVHRELRDEVAERLCMAILKGDRPKTLCARHHLARRCA